MSNITSSRRSQSVTRKAKFRKRHYWQPELLEPRLVLSATGLPGNDCPPDLDLSAVAPQSVEAGRDLVVDLLAVGGTAVDLDADGNPTGDTLFFQLDPDSPEQTPVGARISAAGVFRWTPTIDQVGVYDIVVIITDQGDPALGDAETFRLEVTQPDSLAPFIDLNGPEDGTGFAATFTEGDDPIAIVSQQLNISDPDNTHLQNATVTITNLADGDAESLFVETRGSCIMAAYDPATGVLSLTGRETIASYERVLRTLIYGNSSENPTAGDRTIEVTVNDGEFTSNTATSTVTVEGENDAPDLAPIGGGVAVVDTEFTQTVTATDADGDTLQFQLDYDVTPASATIEQIDNNMAIIRWTPTAGDGDGPFQFRVIVTDDGDPALADSETFLVTLGVVPVVDLNGTAEGEDFTTSFTEDDGPVPLADPELTIDSDGEVTGARIVITNAADGENELLAVNTAGTNIQSAYDAATGALVLSGIDSADNYAAVLASLTYDNLSETPTELDRIIEVVVNDGILDGRASTTTVSVTATNDPPSLTLPAPYDSAEEPVELMLGSTVEFMARASDPEADTMALTYNLDLEDSSISDGATVPTMNADGSFSWTPSETGTFTITVIVVDPEGAADQETFIVTVVEPMAALTASPPASAFSSTSRLAPVVSEDAPPATGRELAAQPTAETARRFRRVWGDEQMSSRDTAERDDLESLPGPSPADPLDALDQLFSDLAW